MKRSEMVQKVAEALFKHGDGKNAAIIALFWSVCLKEAEAALKCVEDMGMKPPIPSVRNDQCPACGSEVSYWTPEDEKP